MRKRTLIWLVILLVFFLLFLTIKSVIGQGSLIIKPRSSSPPGS